MTTERHGAVSFQGNPLTALGNALKPGDAAPDFALVANNMSTKSLADYAGKVKLISVVPSLDTSVCAAQTRRFNEEASALGDDVVILTVSADLPFAQARWCGAEGIENVETLSDHQTMNFGTAYGTHIKEWRMEQRSVIVVGADDVVTYVEYVQEVPDSPDFAAALAAAKSAVTPDDLTKIEGIGPKINDLLQDAGIRTFAKLATCSADDIKAVLNAAGSRFAIADPTTWAEQSVLAVAGNWDALTKLQDELDGGKR